ncbi:MAG TPA: SDR family oxidoreductase [Mycobacteriales bacterium]|nr:SDR family oxidoreductase [Mycobacteriales bacterium]
MTALPADLTGQVVAITGAARGLGAELARQVTARGGRVALLGLEGAELQAVSASCPGSAAWEVDVTDGAALSAVAAQVAEAFGRVDVVVANAGIGGGGSLLIGDPASYDRIVQVNLLGSIRTVRAFLPHLIASRGYVLQVASLAAIVPVPLMSAYCASKSGAEAFGNALRTELTGHGVRVGIAYLSWTDTDMVRGADATPGLGEFRAKLPGVLGKTYPLEPATARIVDGIVRRRRQVFAQPWLRVLPKVRGLLPWVVERTTRGLAADAERALLAAGADATRAVGAGGSADTRAAQQ